ncbi:MAG: hypothetical protein AB1792_07950 [Candidatus Zixiibacteriota bacterium]
MWRAYARPYAALTRSDGQSGEFAELGLGFTMGKNPNEYEPDEWIVRVDVPMYSSHGDRSSVRAKWDLRRFVFRVNLPFPSLTRDQEIRYRYPGR